MQSVHHQRADESQTTGRGQGPRQLLTVSTFRRDPLSVADPGGGENGVTDVMADGDSDGGVQIGDGADGDDGGADDNDRDNTTGDDGNSESTNDDQFIPITVEEVSKLFSKCKDGKACGPDNLTYICTYLELIS